MNLQQLRYILEVSKRKLSVSEAAEALYTSQPGVSKQIRLLEEELGIDIFVRHGKRLVAITEPGLQVMAIAERMLREADNLRQVGADFRNEDSGRLIVATTHTQARYALPRVVADFMRRYPRVQLHIHQGNPRQICEQVLAGEADIAIATEAAADMPDLVLLPCHQWNRSVIAKRGHPILRESPLTLEAINRFPVITYDAAFAGRSLINKAFLARGLKPNVVLTAIDSDVIKTYVNMDLGIGIIASMAFDPLVDRDLAALDASHLFESSTTRIGLPRNTWLRGYAYAFIEMFAPHLSRRVVDAALGGDNESDPGL
ncbi:MAG: transcriptional regulator CysB [Candidatus Dactylopiibacterium carminicum]|uniref:Transcriptional regulator CysB n=1 Tax=Candidatus Dactylopiibacterium carminicum TaxID=857335 RepID=A0A272EWS6_9RHOO|nr:HTH-type transcriptional regulator CysB [Candidatus Dactylopiibacterium carminicum]KAF7600046.1 HTH-type transcriptional regulator CysB [Candidatus Dactylopiibacterium carminicum]PAS94564.1 MAG: transcriptional regulator CysB [Candidatus Dactylopiibacterium carminicum]PAS97603.1 MAG: transcriptional regulator CysB [Candidatus Dactylopiibacterium carminicum]PAT00050.1 MAG: transcriptional regulator CysB [Candidatus Dactylopiibacterium carminicum]